jgi:hypothetical protein
MTLPNFVGIGTAKSGTTWLHELLKEHPKIYMPEKRKEINFFNIDDNYDKGLSWYESFFPNFETAKQYKAIGEFTPRYLNQPEKCAKRIASIKSIEKLILMIRNPINRVYSQYAHAVRAGYNKGFKDFLSDRPWVIKHSFYGRNLEPFLEFYTGSQICCLVFEECITNLDFTKNKIANFLEVVSEEFPDTAGLKKVNQSYIPKYSKINYMASIINKKLIDRDLDWVVQGFNWLRNSRILKITSQNNQIIKPIDRDIKMRLQDTFTDDIQKLEKLLNINLDIWLNKNN